MKILHQFLEERETEKLPPAEQKKWMRPKLLEQRNKMREVADPENWGPKQFKRALELLKLKKIDDLKGIYRVACYFPIRGELDFTRFAQKDWLFPRMQEDGSLLWFEYGDGVENYSVNPHGIREKELQYCFAYKNTDLPLLCFLPGLAASQDGSRLGYGGGYYDRFLREHREKITAVFCLPSKDFLFNALPLEEQDEKVDLIVF